MESKKTCAINEAKCASMHLYANDCFNHDKSTFLLGRGKVNEKVKNMVIKDLISIGKSASSIEGPCSINELYNAIIETGNTITVYDLINWFNEQYKLIKEEAKALPKLEFDLYKAELGKSQRVCFTLTDIFDKGESLFFEDINAGFNDFARRTLSIGSNFMCDGTEFSISLIGRDWYSLDDEDTFKINKDIAEAYIELSKKYYDYLKAYAFLRRSNDQNFSTTRYQRGPLPTYIYGTDPLRDLNQFLVHYGTCAGNDIGYIITYDLGESSLGNPTLVFSDNSYALKDGPDTQEEIRENYPHMLARTLRINKNNLPFNIK